MIDALDTAAGVEVVRACGDLENAEALVHSAGNLGEHFFVRTRLSEMSETGHHQRGIYQSMGISAVPAGLAVDVVDRVGESGRR